MRPSSRLAVGSLAAGALLVSVAGPALADHNANNRATFTQGAAGTAIASYSEGTGLFNAGISARELAPGTYTYRVAGGMTNGVPNEPQPICRFAVRSAGTGSCHASDLRLKGFTKAEIVRDGTVVSTATFVRQGRSECRDPQQAGPESATCPNRA